MTLIPVFRVPSVGDAIPFYRDIVGFTLDAAMPDEAPFYAVLSLNGAELHLQQDAGAAEYRHIAIIRVADADAALAALIAAGYRPPSRPDSPVHQGPIDQSWGTREFNIDDPSGNTLCFAAPIRPLTVRA